MSVITEMFNILIAEYLSKCKCCDECMASTFCTLEQRRDSREPKEYCKSNLKDYLKDRVVEE